MVKQIFKIDFSDQTAATSVANTSATEGIFKWFLKISSMIFMADFLYLSSGVIAEVPSFIVTTDFSIPLYPEGEVSFAVSGIVDQKLFICGGR